MNSNSQLNNKQIKKSLYTKSNGLPEADVGLALFENTGTFRELFGAVFGRFGG